MNKINNKRKTIAVCVSGYSWENESRIIAEIARKCKKNDVNLLIFASLMLKGDYPKGIGITKNLVRGESEIFNLINYELVDGVIIFGNTIYRRESIQEIAAACDSHNIPYVDVNDPGHPLKHNVLIENVYAMELVIEHLVKVHHLTKINFIGGYPDNKETIERLSAYKKILTENNIPVDEKRIGYGHFWKAAVDCTKEFLKYDIPEAIVCANDTMAILVSDYLKNQGYRIPQDVIVTGYDGTSDADTYKPALTTVRPAYETVGTKTYELLEELMNGNQKVEDITVNSELIIQESCGCMHYGKTEDNYIDSKYMQRNTYDAFHMDLIKTSIFFADSETSDELFDHLLSGLWIFGLKRFYFCINSELEERLDNFQRKSKFAVSKRVICKVPYFHNVPKNTKFDSSDLLPEPFLDGEEPVIMAFTPLYFKDKYLGYSAFEPGKMQGAGELFLLWSQSAANDIGSFYLKSELENQNLKDPLTGLYNRRGMSKKFGEVFESFSNAKEHLYIVCADIDYLKKINDNYGHEAGDIAILQSAKALEKAFKDGVCVRTGGDEFCILIHSLKTLDLPKMIEKVDSYLDDYNAKSGLPFKVTCSCGYVYSSSEKFTNFAELQSLADEKLYEAKAIHHEKL